MGREEQVPGVEMSDAELINALYLTAGLIIGLMAAAVYTIWRNQ